MPRYRPDRKRPQGPELAWWVEPVSGRLGYNDGRLPEPGVTHRMPNRMPNPQERPNVCVRGMHGCKNPLDALSYNVRSQYIWRVELSGDIDISFNKLAARDRRYIKRIDLRAILHREYCRLARQLVKCFENKRTPGLTKKLKEMIKSKDAIKNRAEISYELRKVPMWRQNNWVIYTLQILFTDFNNAIARDYFTTDTTLRRTLGPQWGINALTRIRRAIEKEAQE